MIRLGVGVRVGRSAIEYAASRLPQIMATTLSPITTLSAPGDPVATLSVANPAAGETYTWSLVDDAGGAVQINASTGAVTVLDASGVGLQTTFTVRITGSPSGATFDRVITTPVASSFVLEIETGFVLEIEPGFALALHGNAAEATGHLWENTYFTEARRPAMSDVLVISTQAQLDAFVAQYSELPPGHPNPASPAGSVYTVNKSGSWQDLEIDGTNLTFAHPLKADGWRNIWLHNVEYTATPIAAGAAGMLSNYNESGGLIANTSLYPRLVGGSAFQLAASHTTLVEGVFIDMLGHNNDAIVVNSIAGRTAAQDRADKNVYLINSVIKGYRGHLANYSSGGPGGGPLGDGFHADAIQMQSETGSYNEFIAENVDVYSAHEGFVMNCIGTDQPGRAVVHRVLFRIDERYIDPVAERTQFIAPIGVNARNLLLKDVYPYTTQIWNGSAVATNYNHLLHWPAGQSPQYFTDHNSGWANTGAGTSGGSIVPVSATEIDTLTFSPNPDFRPGTNVIAHDGMTSWLGTGNPPNGTETFAPADHVGRAYSFEVV